MASLEQPPTITRVVEVKDPGGNFVVVYVRIPLHLASKYPDKPWGTPIEDVGLAAKDIVRFAGYTLVDLELVSGRRTGDTSDLFWVFQKLPGPVWTTTTHSREGLIPPMFREAVSQLKTKQEVVPDTEPSELAGDLVFSVVEQQEDTGKAIKVEVVETLTEVAALGGRVAYVERDIGLTSDELVVDGTQADSGLLVVSSRVSPLGNGKSVKETVDVAEWTEHTGTEWNPELGVQIAYTEQFVAPPDLYSEPPDPALQLPNTDFQIVNKDRSLKRVRVIPTAALTSFTLAYPTRINLDLPKVLKTVSVVWDSQVSVGTQETQGQDFASGGRGSVSLAAPDTASSSALIKAEVQITFEDFAATNLFAENRLFYMEGPVTSATILAKLATLYGQAVAMWPVFKPQSSTITVSGQSINVRANVQVSLTSAWGEESNSFSWLKSTSDDFAIGSSFTSVQLPPCIHPDITITGDTYREQEVSATAELNVSLSFGPSVSASLTKSGTAYGRVTPSVVPGTSGLEAIPVTGLYLIDLQVETAAYTNWFKVRAVVFDALTLS